MKNPLSETFKIAIAVSAAFNGLNLVVTAFCKSVGVWNIAGIALKLVDSEYARKLVRLWKSYNIEDTNHRRNGQVDAFGDRGEKSIRI